jgi:hypothetical protein
MFECNILGPRTQDLGSKEQPHTTLLTFHRATADAKMAPLHLGCSGLITTGLGQDAKILPRESSEYIEDVEIMRPEKEKEDASE